MTYSHYSIESLKELHHSVRKCLEEDDNTPEGEDKPYGVREFSDWAEHLTKIETELSKKGANFTPIIIFKENQKPIPPELALYDKIRDYLEYEDKLPDNSEKLYEVRKNSDWKKQADSLEKALDSKEYPYKKIVW